MSVRLAASTGARIDVWREDDLFHARRADHVTEPQTCLGVDLFEVIAELFALDLNDAAEAAEAISLAEEAQHRLESR
jgi:hypothetical protein